MNEIVRDVHPNVQAIFVDKCMNVKAAADWAHAMIMSGLEVSVIVENSEDGECAALAGNAW